MIDVAVNKLVVSISDEFSYHPILSIPAKDLIKQGRRRDLTS